MQKPMKHLIILRTFSGLDSFSLAICAHCKFRKTYRGKETFKIMQVSRQILHEPVESVSLNLSRGRKIMEFPALQMGSRSVRITSTCSNESRRAMGASTLPVALINNQQQWEHRRRLLRQGDSYYFLWNLNWLILETNSTVSILCGSAGIYIRITAQIHKIK